MKSSLAVSILFVLCLTAVTRASSPTSVVNSPHNLSVSGPGTIKATSEQEVCIFCHTPHNSSPVQPLWNRNVPTNSYQIYSSSTFNSTLVPSLGQPSGSSKLCLSCHDGTIALGSVVSSQSMLTMQGGMTTLTGTANLGTNLSGSHPISFTYDANLQSQYPNLVNPTSLIGQVQLEGGKVQCISCHSPHDNSQDPGGNFLVMNNTNSQLCTSCHVINGEAAISGHDQCNDCHQQHNSPSAALLLNQDNVTDTCLVCHSGGVPAVAVAPAVAVRTNALAMKTPLVISPHAVSTDINKISRHNKETSPSQLAAQKNSSRQNITDQVSCADCHESHTIATGERAAPLLPPNMGKVSGTNAAGTNVTRARFEYEVCFKCHGLNNSSTPYIPRNIVQPNVARQFATSSISFHPVEGPGRGTDVPSLAPGLTVASVIYCKDCHGSDTSKAAGGSGSNGPHGSDFPPLLLLRCETHDGTSESDQAYTLCYRCHQRTSILGNESFSKHQLHVVDQRVPCTVCHDSHGISSAQATMLTGAHLINFDTSVVRPDPITKRLQYRSTGPRRGQCYLLCHGKVHSGTSYP